MRELREAIEKMGIGVGCDIVKVDTFLNHRIDTKLLFQMGEEFARHFSPDKPDIILTVESSGIALAVAAAHALGDLPVVFAKKSPALNQGADMVLAPVYSFTHKTQGLIRTDKSFLPDGARVLIIDDFLADGQAARGLIGLIAQTKATLCGVGIAIEKGFQRGGQQLREMGVNLLSLAVVDGIEDGKIVLSNGC